MFPVESQTAHVVLRAGLQRPLTSFTVCLNFYTDLIRGYTVFSFATHRSDNEIVLFKPNPNQFVLHMRTGTVPFNAAEKLSSKPSWEHACVSWESATGLVEVMLDGKIWPRKGIMKGQSISAEASVVLGQDQDNFGGGFERASSFIGEVKNVYMWDRVLSSEEMINVWNKQPVSNPVINWRTLNYDIRGYVVLKPSLNLW